MIPQNSLILPTYNATAFIEDSWRGLVPFLQAGWEILFVCDGCTDDTVVRLEELRDADRSAAVRILSYAPNRGKGHAVRRGMAEARGRWRLFTDVDLAYCQEDVFRLAQVLQAGAPAAIASRCHPDSRLVLPPCLQGYAYRRHLQSLGFSAVVRRILPLSQRDTQAGLKGLSADAARLLLPHLQCDGFGFDCELLTACRHFGLPVTEVPVQVRMENRASTTGLGTMTRMLKELYQIRKNWSSKPPVVAEIAGESRKAA